MNLPFATQFRSIFGLLAVLYLSCVSAPAMDDRFALVQTKTAVYTNVTVTTKAKDYIVIQHAGGLMSIKHSELTPESFQALGFGNKPADGGSFTIAAKARALVSALPTKQIESALGNFRPTLETPLTANAITIGASLGLIHLIFSYCTMLVCAKAGTPGGLLAWIPIIQIYALHRAAKMSPMWLLALVVPLLNLWAHVLWSVKISKARGSGGLTALFLIIPLTFPFAFLYLASAQERKTADSETPPEKLRASGLMFETS